MFDSARSKPTIETQLRWPHNSDRLSSNINYTTILDGHARTTLSLHYGLIIFARAVIHHLNTLHVALAVFSQGIKQVNSE